MGDVVVVVVSGVDVFLVVDVVVVNVYDVDAPLVGGVVVVVVFGVDVFLVVDVVVVYVYDVGASLVGDVVVPSQLTSLSFSCATSMPPSWETSLSSSLAA